MDSGERLTAARVSITGTLGIRYRSPMQRRNPGPFEPIIYVIQTPTFFRIVGIGGLILFTLVFLAKAAHHSAGGFVVGVLLLVALWTESSLTVCRRCRHFGTWHCGGQAKL